MSDGQLAVAVESENLMINADENTVENTDETNNNNNGNDVNDDIVVTSEQNEVNIDRTNLIINYLPNGLDETRLRELFNEFGSIESLKIVKDRNANRSLGYGFVKYFHEDDALRAIEQMNHYSIENKTLKVSIARVASLDIRNCKLYITNIPLNYTESDVIAVFERFGEIIECRLVKDLETSASKGVGFVQFNIRHQAERAFNEMNGQILTGAIRPLNIKYAEDQYKKKELGRLQNQLERISLPVQPLPVSTPRITRTSVQIAQQQQVLQQHQIIQQQQQLQLQQQQQQQQQVMSIQPIPVSTPAPLHQPQLFVHVPILPPQQQQQQLAPMTIPIQQYVSYPTVMNVVQQPQQHQLLPLQQQQLLPLQQQQLLPLQQQQLLPLQQQQLLPLQQQQLLPLQQQQFLPVQQQQLLPLQQQYPLLSQQYLGIDYMNTPVAQNWGHIYNGQPLQHFQQAQQQQQNQTQPIITNIPYVNGPYISIGHLGRYQDQYNYYSNHQANYSYYNDGQYMQQQLLSQRNNNIIVPISLYVSNVPISYDEQKICDFFTHYGRVKNVTLLDPGSCSVVVDVPVQSNISSSASASSSSLADTLVNDDAGSGTPTTAETTPTVNNNNNNNNVVRKTFYLTMDVYEGVIETIYSLNYISFVEGNQPLQIYIDGIPESTLIAIGAMDVGQQQQQQQQQLNNTER